MTTQEIDQHRSERAADAPGSGTQTQAKVGRMENTISRDGTRIAYRRSGEGPPLILVHGTAANHGRWSPVLPALEERFTVYAMDRRGRGGSGDGQEDDLRGGLSTVVRPGLKSKKGLVPWPETGLMFCSAPSSLRLG